MRYDKEWLGLLLGSYHHLQDLSSASFKKRRAVERKAEGKHLSKVEHEKNSVRSSDEFAYASIFFSKRAVSGMPWPHGD